MIRVIGKKILVKIIEKEVEDTGPIFIPESGKDELILLGSVECVGDDDILISEGEKVYFNKYSSVKITHNNVEYYVMHVDEILAVYK